MAESYTSLFFGMPITKTYLSALNQGKMEIYQHYLKEEYLAEFELNGLSYVGKKVGETLSVKELPRLQEHIYSLLTKITPEFSFENHPLELIPYRL